MSKNTKNTMEYADLEQKYMDVKRKFRKIKEHNEILTLDVEKLTASVKQLENEKLELENQLDQNHHHSNDSDENSSYANNQANTELITVIQSKNEQISNLLKDIENVELENAELKENLNLVKNELEKATSSIVALTETVGSKEALLDEQNETFQSITLELNSLQTQLELCKNEKAKMKLNLDQFSLEIGKKIDKWKSILNKKNLEIKTLKKTIIKSHTATTTGTPFSPTTTTAAVAAPADDENPSEINPIYMENLQKKLSTTQTQLNRLKIELNSCTENLNESTEVLNKVNKEKCKIEDDLKIEIAKTFDLKQQLNRSHDRCQKMQEQIEFSDRMSKMLKIELNNLYSKLKTNPEQIEAAQLLEEMHRLKIDNFHGREKIRKLIKDFNLTQEEYENSKLENTMLKKKLGMNPTDTLNIEGHICNAHSRKERLKFNKNSLEEENLALRLEVQQLNKRISDVLNNKSNPNNDLLMNEIEDLKSENQVLRNSLLETLKNEQSDCERPSTNGPIKINEESNQTDETIKLIENERASNKLIVAEFQQHEQQYLIDIGNLQEEISTWKKRFQQQTEEMEKERQHFETVLTTLQNAQKNYNLTQKIVFQDEFRPLELIESEVIKLPMKNQFVQVSLEVDENAENLQQFKRLEMKMNLMENSLIDKEEIIMKKDIDLQECKRQMNQKDKQIAMLNEKLEDKIQQVVGVVDNGGGGDGMNFYKSEVMELKMALQQRTKRIAQKDEEIVKYQTMLIENKNKINNYDSLSKELHTVQKALAAEQDKCNNLVALHEKSNQKYELMERYINQVHLLEKHLADMHTQQTKLETQIRCAQDELVRWKEIAQDRLVAMEELGTSLDEQHRRDLNTYKIDNEKLMEIIKKNETNNKHLSSASSSSGTHSLVLDPEILKLVRDKDEKIKELNEKIQSVVTLDSESNTKTSITDQEKLVKENRMLRRKYQSVVEAQNKAKDEIGHLKEQIAKRSQHYPIRNDQTEKNQIKQLQNKITMYENQLAQLNVELTEQRKIAQKYKIACDENFDNWKKLKHWQENYEKYKSKFDEAEEKLKKQEETCAGHRFLIERLERDKMNSIKSFKAQQKMPAINQEIHLLQTENAKLICENVDLKNRLKNSEN